MDEDEWLTLYIILFFVAFISGLALLAARTKRKDAYEPWHARLAAVEGKPRRDRIIISKTSTSWVSDVLLSVVALAAIVVWAIFFRSSSSDLQISATLRDIQAAQHQTTSKTKVGAHSDRTKAINDSNAAEDQLAHDNASVAEQPKALTQMARDNASAAEKLGENREHTASVFAKESEESLRPQTPFARPSPKPAIPKRRQIVMRNWF